MSPWVCPTSRVMLSRIDHRRASSLVETIIGGFLVLTAIAILSALVDNSLRLKANATQYSTAVLIATNKLEELRAFGVSNGYKDLAIFDGLKETSAMDSAFTISIEVSKRALYSPSRSLESARGVEAKILEDSVKKVIVTVSWGGSEDLSVIEYFGDLYVKDIELKASIDKFRVGPNEEAKLTVVARDESGDEVEDLSFRWYVSPLGGLGTIKGYSRTGAEATYVNECRASGGRLVSYPGQCSVTVVTKYKRQRYSDTIVIDNM
jgi:hypothetical protein